MAKTSTPPRPLTAREFFARYLRVPEIGTRRLVPLVFHPEQAALIDAFDARDAAGAPRYDELANLWAKKTGKSETDGGLALAELATNVSEPDREVIIVASDLAQSKEYTFQSARRFVDRDAYLRKHFRVLSTEIVYRETVTDARTG